jgi:hypothetical protein
VDIRDDDGFVIFLHALELVWIFLPKLFIHIDSGYKGIYGMLQNS